MYLRETYEHHRGDINCTIRGSALPNLSMTAARTNLLCRDRETPESKLRMLIHRLSSPGGHVQYSTWSQVSFHTVIKLFLIWAVFSITP